LFVWFPPAPNAGREFALNACLGAGGAGIGVWGADLAGLFNADEPGSLIAALLGAATAS
jgi:hypothetical protein